MAYPGNKPKPALLHLINGTRNATRHGSEGELVSRVESAIEDFGPLVRPDGLSLEAIKCWNEMIEPAKWLDGSKKLAAAALCELYAEWTMGPRHFAASKHSQMRSYMADLGLTDERNRVTLAKKVKDEFFDD